MVTKTDYGQREVEACKSVLVELVHLLGEFRDSKTSAQEKPAAAILPSGIFACVKSRANYRMGDKIAFKYTLRPRCRLL